MKRGLHRTLVGPPARRPGDGAPRRTGWLRRQSVPWWQVVIAAAAVVAAVVAVWVTLEAEFLAYPGWLAAQKADFILGPVFIGLYWLRRRPLSRFGPMLIGFGFIGALYILQSASNSWLFSIGLLAETAIGLATRVLILAFPTGRLDRPAKVILVISIFVSPLPAVVNQLLSPQSGAGASISGCRQACPSNEFAVTSNPELAADLLDVFRFGVIIASSLTASLLIWRFVKGTPPQRRALAIGTPIALLFLAFQITFQLLGALDAPQSDFSEFVKWAFVGARAAIWYGFLFALVAAQLFAGRALQRLVRASLRRPSQREVETMLREPLGDPRLRLVFREPDSETRPDAEDGDLALRSTEPGSGRSLTVVERDGSPAVAILHDVQLNDDPELLQAAGAVALLAEENAELDAAWSKAVDELQQSRARIVRAGDNERRKLERNLHDAVQQSLVAIRVNLALTSQLSDLDPVVRSRLDGIGQSVEEALEELREVSHGLYPPVLSDWGLVKALESIQRPSVATLAIRATGIGRYPAELESAVYYCCLEAIQNATKHGGYAVHVAVTLREDADELRFEVSDDGPGFDLSTVRTGAGLQNMRDRLGALGGHLSIVTAVGQGSVVSGSVPLSGQ
jgi:signal transduction histidine kinase